MHPRRCYGMLVLCVGMGWFGSTAWADPSAWRAAWPRTDFSLHTVAWDEILTGGVPRDGIPSIDAPVFRPVGTVDGAARSTEPVISLVIDSDARAYPLSILIWHEIVNDRVADRPVTITYCPLCNSGVVYDASLDGRHLTFGTTGKLRHSDLVMYDHQTESWWQQFLGTAIVGTLTGAALTVLPSRLESLARFAERHPAGRVLVPGRPGIRPYGRNPYVGYDGSEFPFLYRGDYDGPVPALSRVVVVAGEAWSLAMLRDRRRIVSGDLVISWLAGQASALDAPTIAAGRDVGNVVVQRRTANGLIDVAYDVPFAFAFKAFHPDGMIHHNPSGSTARAASR